MRSLADMHPELLMEWDFKTNQENPYIIAPKSTKKVWWDCGNGHSYLCPVRYMVLSQPSCFECNPKGSRNGNGWLDDIGINIREYYININGKKYFVDGFNPKNNVVFEYLGNFWHGNPEFYEQNEKHPILNKTYGQLYEETMDKITTLVRSGYKVFYKWGP